MQCTVSRAQGFESPHETVFFSSPPRPERRRDVARAGRLRHAAAGCATPPPAAPPLEQIAPPAWIAPLPHAGSAVALADWWRAAGDATLT
ncbi:MAG: hypothetical protein KBE14_05480, partial [Ottowia sp.]|nr:hypothetical protein [Ottowia sp.]